MTQGACIFRRTKAAAAPPAKIVLPAPKPVENKPQPEIAPPAIVVETPPPDTPKALEIPPEVPPAPKPATPKRARPRPAQAAEAPAPVGPSVPQQPAQPPIQLAPLLTEAEHQSYSAAVTDLLAKAERNIAATEGKRLTASQREIVEQARSLIAQAVSARTRDLAAAKSLAERAEILSRELLR